MIKSVTNVQAAATMLVARLFAVVSFLACTLASRVEPTPVPTLLLEDRDSVDQATSVLGSLGSQVLSDFFSFATAVASDAISFGNGIVSHAFPLGITVVKHSDHSAMTVVTLVGGPAFTLAPGGAGVQTVHNGHTWTIRPGPTPSYDYVNIPTSSASKPLFGSLSNGIMVAIFSMAVGVVFGMRAVL